MSLSNNLSTLAIRVAAECKALRTLVNGNGGDLADLATSTKANLVAAINEVHAAQGGAGVSFIPDGGLYVVGPQVVTTTTTGVQGGRVFLVPFLVEVETLYDRIALNVATGISGSARMGLYASAAGLVGRPGTLVFDAGAVNTASPGIKEAVIAQTLQPGVYWVATQCSVTMTLYCINAVAAVLGINMAAMTPNRAYVLDTTFGPLPADLTGKALAQGAGMAPLTVLRKAPGV